MAAVLRRLALLCLGLFSFVLALELLKRGAGGLAPLLHGLSVAGLAGGVGFGWLFACLLLAGSPVAAIALALLAGGTLVSEEAFGMVVGSRLGASFVVLVIGALDDLRARRVEKRSAYVGVTALVATAVIYVPAGLVGLLGLRAGWVADLRVDGREVGSVLRLLFAPLAGPLAASLHPLLLFVAGLLALLGAFRLFDALLPDLRGRESPLLHLGEILYRPWFLFALGFGVTALTLSVSVSISLLVPLTARGYVRRENLCPYILGANVTTLVDTLFAGALVGHPDGARIVVLLMACVAAFSLPAVLLFPYAFARAVDRVAVRATRDARSLRIFTALVLAIPALLLAW
ncbi:MAG: hypothetical protein AB7O37_13940 [Vicinamibacteria bacterium]